MICDYSLTVTVKFCFVDIVLTVTQRGLNSAWLIECPMTVLTIEKLYGVMTQEGYFATVSIWWWPLIPAKNDFHAGFSQPKHLWLPVVLLIFCLPLKKCFIAKCVRLVTCYIGCVIASAFARSSSVYGTFIFCSFCISKSWLSLFMWPTFGWSKKRKKNLIKSCWFSTNLYVNHILRWQQLDIWNRVSRISR